MKKVVSLILFLSINVVTLAQVLSGFVIDEEKAHPIQMASCKLTDVNDAIISYCITKSDGFFSLNLSPKATSLIVSYIGYEDRRLAIKDIGKNITIEMKPMSKNLPEAIVMLPPISRSKDTLNYNVASFISKNDKYLTDILKKMPGIEVTGNGSIKYQGRPISRFNIEGRNLLGSRYNQASQNMPIEAIATVQILENNQPVRALENKMLTEQTTLNIKLKKDYKTKPFGEIIIGGGGLDKILWNDKFTIFNISSKSQTLITAETNNTGKSLLDFSFGKIDMTDMKTIHILPTDMLSDITLRQLPIQKGRYADNKSYSLGANHLFTLSEYSTLTLSLTYMDERICSNDSSHYEYGGNNKFYLSERNGLTKRSHLLAPSIKYEINAKNIFIEDELKALIGKSDIDNTLKSNSNEVYNNLGKRPRLIQNNLQLIVNAGKNVYTAHSFIRHYSSNEYTTSPFEQKLQHNQTLAENSISTRLKVCDYMLDCEYSNEYISDNYIIHNDKSKNTVFTQTFKPKCDLNIGKNILKLAFPVNLSGVKAHWNNRNSNKLHLSPSISWTYRHNPLFSINVGASYKETTADELTARSSYYSNYRTLSFPLDKTGWKRRWNANLSLSYQSILHLLSWYLVANASWTRNDHYYEYTYTENITTRKPIGDSNWQRMFYAVTSMNKTFTKGVNIKASLDFNRTETLMAQNGIKSIYQSNVLSCMVDLYFTRCKWLNASYSATGNINWYDSEPDKKLKSLYNVLDISIFLKRLTLNAKAENNIVEVAKGEYRSNTFIDFTIDYLLSKRLSFMIKATNLCNQRTFVNAGWNGLNYSYFSRPIRGCEIILSAVIKI